MLWYAMLLFLEGEKGCAVLVMCTEKCRFPFSIQKQRKDKSRGKEISSQWKAACGKSARTV